MQFCFEYKKGNNYFFIRKYYFGKENEKNINFLY